MALAQQVAVSDMHRTDVFGSNRPTAAVAIINRSKMSPSTYAGSCLLTPAGLLYCLVVLLLHQIPSSVANGKVTSFLFFLSPSFCLSVWARSGKQNTKCLTLNHQPFFDLSRHVRAADALPTPFSPTVNEKHTQKKFSNQDKRKKRKK